MSRMYSRKRGKSSSTRPYRTSPPKWVEYSQDEIAEIIVKLAKKGEHPSKIGVILRDQYGIPTTKLMTQQRVTQILKEKGLSKEIPEDLMNLMKTAVNLEKHRATNKKDMVSKRGMQLVESKIRRLAKYYKREGVLPAEWKYDLKAAKLLVE
ncbi:MAG: 30S ribosomal protein S15 [Candidatus Hydrothermarchaeales archaeon]